MHDAPAVCYPVGRSFFHGVLVGIAGLVGILTGMVWFAGTSPTSWRQWLFATVLLATWSAACEVWRRGPQGSLSWDGRIWAWSVDQALVKGRVLVHIDFQAWMVLSLRTEQGVTIWLWPEKRSDALSWDPLRRAVFARIGAGASPTPDAGTPSARAKL